MASVKVRPDPGNAPPDLWSAPLDPAEHRAIADLAARALVEDHELRPAPKQLRAPEPRSATTCVCAPVLNAEMSVWTSLGGADWGCCGNAAHTFGFHLPADNLPRDDYSLTRDDGSPVNRSWACAIDPAHQGKPALRAMHATLLGRLMANDPALWMIVEYIGQPWANKPVLYWARWNGVANVKNYTGAGHDMWSHVSIKRSAANQRPDLWRTGLAPSMTQYLVDIASYQAGMNLATVKAAGFDLVNIKTSQGNWYTYPEARQWADKARSLGMGISTFHWLDNSATGGQQANIAYKHMANLGGPAGMAHQCDCEDNATWVIFRDYVNAMQQLLGRPIVIYTGDWWWTAPGRNWNGASLSPYLWAAPNNGYLSSYPGDAAGAWQANYGGWGDYSILQYAVQPISGAGGGNVSKSAIRDPKVWAALTGGSVPTPQQTTGARNMQVLVQLPTGGTVWLATGTGKLRPLTEGQYLELVRAHKAGQITLDNGGKIILTESPTAYGAEPGDEAGPSPWTDEQMTAFAGAVSAAIVSTPSVPVDDVYLTEVHATVVRAIKGLSFVTQVDTHPAAAGE